MHVSISIIYKRQFRNVARVYIDSHSYSRNICTLGAAIDTASRTNTYAGKRRSGCFFWSRVSVRSVGVEYEEEHDEERKEISTFGPRRPELSFGISRRWDVAAPGEGREDHPASLSTASVLHFLARLRSLFFVLANFDDFSR